MKRILLVLAASVALSASGQVGQEAPKTASGAAVDSRQPTTVIIQGNDSRTHELQLSQAACPVQILQASFERPAQFMLTAHSQVDDTPTLRLEYQNLSGKDIDSVLLTGWIKVKDNPYQLDSVTHPFQMELSREALLGKNVQATQALKLVSNAIGFDRIELSRVNYADGTAWTPERRSCVYSNMGATERARAW